MEKNTDPRYKIISQNKKNLLPTYPIFFQHVIGNRLFFCLALGKFRVIKSVLYAQHKKIGGRKKIRASRIEQG